MLHQAVLAGVIRNHRHDATGSEPLAQRRKGAFQHTQLVVDGDADRLEERRELWRPAARTEHGANGVHEIIAGAQGAIGAPSHDFAGQSSGSRLIGVFAEDPDQFVLVAVVEDARRVGLGIGPHSHVERRAGPEGEAATFFVDLMRRDAEIEQDAVPVLAIEFGTLVDFGKIRAHRLERTAALVQFERGRGGVNRGGILIDSSHAGTLFEERECVPASSKRTVQDVPSVAEQLGDLAGENRRVKGWESG